MDKEEGKDIIWVNAFIGRVLFDCLREQVIVQKLKERIQRKLASIRLPYFIQEISCQELNLGTHKKLKVTPTLRSNFQGVRHR